MADETPSLQIDTDWKKQAQEEKRRLAEQQKQAQAQTQPPAGAAAPAGAAPSGAPAGATATRDPRERGTAREMPPASFATLVQSLVTQALFSLGEIAVRGSAPQVDLDAAKHHIDTLGVLEQKTANNLTDDERRMLDSALYETRMRYVSTASQYIS